jgi:Domain of unknown function (DUF6457)
MTGEEWIAAYATALGVPPPSAEEIEQILDLAGDAAHASERIAAPVACWLAARAGVTLERASDVAHRVAPV